MIGMVLAAGAGRRLQPYTDTLPKTLLPVDGDRTILDVALAQLRRASASTDVVVVTGYAAEAHRGAPGRARGAPRRARSSSSSTTRPRSGTTPTRCGARASTSPRRAAGQRRHVAPAVASSETLLRRARRRPTSCIAVDDVQDARRGGDEGPRSTDDGLLTASTRRSTPRTAAGEYIGVTLIEPHAAERAGRRAARRPSSATRSCTTRTASRSSPTAAGASAPRRSATSSGSRSTTTPTWPGPGRSRAAADPHGRHAAGDRHRPGRGRRASAPLLADRRISSGGHVAVAVGPGLGRGDRRRRCGPQLRERRDLHGRGRLGRGRARSSPSALRGGLLRRAGRHRRRTHARHRQVRGDAHRPADGRGRHVAGPRRHRLARRLARGRTAARAPTACRCRSRSWSTSTTCARSEPAMRRVGHRRRRLQPLARSPTGGWPSASAASRSTASP